MLSILLLYFIGKPFYKLAETFNQNKWLFAILGIVAYYAGTLIGGLVIGVASELFDLNINFDDSLTLILIALPTGLLAVYIFYVLLKKNWEKNHVEPIDEISEIGKLPEKDD